MQNLNKQQLIKLLNLNHVTSIDHQLNKLASYKLRVSDRVITYRIKQYIINIINNKCCFVCVASNPTWSKS